MIESIKAFWLRTDARSLRAYKNISVSFVTRGASLAITFIMVPIALDYVGSARYGIWLTISSITAWLSYFDIGLGNGLRNKLGEAIAQGKSSLARTYISSAYSLIIGISVILFICFLLLSNFLDWTKILNTSLLGSSELREIVVLVVLFFCLGFSMKTLNSILEALQLYALKDVIGLGSQILALIGVIVLANFTEGSLLNLCLVYGSQTFIGLAIGSLILFGTKLKDLRPSWRLVNLKVAVPLLTLGGWFFLNQILYLIQTQTSLILVAQLYGPEEVTEFNLSMNYIGMGAMLFIMTLSPFLSAFTEAYTKKDTLWINSTMKKILKVLVVAIVVVLLMAFFYKPIFAVWVDGKVMPVWELILALSLMAIFQMISSIFTLFLNAIGIIRLQFYTLLVSAISFIPLVLLFKSWDLGLISLVIPSILTGLINSFIYFTQYRRVLNRSAKGVWAK
ncbi:MAG: O-antigen/teichoic acid export membrane protein [Sediminicola sp.]|jgi:O-antigen/teichoic acid export membrane protein